VSNKLLRYICVPVLGKLARILGFGNKFGSPDIHSLELRTKNEVQYFKSLKSEASSLTQITLKK
jgi:hypothetical protein